MKTRDVFITRAAEEDLSSAARYIALTLRNRNAARKLLDESNALVSRIASCAETFPFVRDEVARASGYQWAQVGNYMVFFRIDNATNKVIVERIAYKKRNWQALIR